MKGKNVAAVEGSVASADRRRAFTLMGLGFALEGFVLSALLVHMVPLLTAVGLGASAVLVGTLLALRRWSAASLICWQDAGFRH